MRAGDIAHFAESEEFNKSTKPATSTVDEHWKTKYVHDCFFLRCTASPFSDFLSYHSYYVHVY